MRREKVKEKKPEIPQFDPTKQMGPDHTTPMPVPQQVATHKTSAGFHKFIFPILFVMLLLFGIISVAGLLFGNSQQSSVPVPPAPQVQEVKSTGIKIYDNRWVEIPGESTDVLREGDLLYIGVVSVRGANIDMARIKINEPVWSPQHTTTKYNPAFNVYYREYVISPTDVELEIEGQLHDKSTGWLSE